MQRNWRSPWVWLALLMAATFLPWLLRLSRYSDQMGPLDRSSYDWFYALLPGTHCPEVVVITMDQQSHQELRQDPDQVWDRDLHAQLLRKLARDRALLVVFDVFFGIAGRTNTDAELADAMRVHRRVALAVDYSVLSRPGITGAEVSFPIDQFRTNAAGLGLASLRKDADGVVRRPLLEAEGQESLPWVSARLAGAAFLEQSHRLEPRWLRYYGPPAECLSRVRYADALGMSNGFFGGKYVFVGGAPWIKKPGEQSDMFRTPYSRWDASETAGVDLAAIGFLNLLRGDGLGRLGPLPELAWLLCSALLMAGALRWRAVGARVVSVMLLAGLSSAAAFGLLVHGHLWFAWLVPVLVQLPISVVAAFALRPAPAGEATLCPAPPPLDSLPPMLSPADLVASGPASGAATELPVVADHTLLRRVGAGAYGEVWVARNAVGILHAVKIIHRRAFESPEPFAREFRGITRFMPIARAHAGFVHVLQVGPEEVSEYFYYVMELADDLSNATGVNVDTYEPKNLSNLLKRRKRLGTDECLRLGLHMTDALHVLHQAQLIHRDIKPSNIIFVRGQPKLADIGLVTRIAAHPRDVSFLGTRGYIPPEGPGTPSADIYSLGKVLYEVYTGLDREQFPSLPTSLLEAPGPGLAALNQVVLKACELDPRQRYQSAAEFHRELLGLQDQTAP